MLWFKSTQDFMNSVSSPSGAQVMVDTQEHLDNVQMLHAEGATIVPFEPRKPGQQCFLVIAHVNYKPTFGTAEEAEHHYLNVHAGSRLASRACAAIMWAGPCNWATSRTAFGRCSKMYDSFDAFQRGMTSRAGQELLKDDAQRQRRRLYFAEAQVVTRN